MRALQTLTLGLALILGLLLAARPALADDAPTAERTFVVHCYDVGAGALKHRPGILAVERGWRGFEEINTVTYDPRRVTVPQIEDWLQAADTYVRTLPAADDKGD